jgi:hypothetical protein
MQFVLWDGRKLTKDIFIKARNDGAPVLVQYNVTKKEALKQDLSRLRKMLDSLTVIGEPARQTLILSFDGWDFDPRSLAEIPEVSAFIKQAVAEYKHIYYYLLPELNQHIFVALIPITMYGSPLFPQPPSAPGIPNERRMVEMDVPAADREIDKLAKAVLQHGIDVDDQTGALVCIQEWRYTLNL